jgi:DNA-binding NtrC family response regulator
VETLPAAMTDSNHSEVLAQPSETSRQAVLLFVDDEPNILSSLRRLFRPLGYRILTAESGAAGLEILGKEEVDLVVSDMRMPSMDGAHFLEAVRQRWPGVTRILLTGYSDINSTVNAINRGEIYRYIAKPWDDHDITLIVREALERRRLENENQRLLDLTQSQNEALKACGGAVRLHRDRGEIS